MNIKNYSYLKKFIKSIKDGLLIPDSAKYLVTANNIANNFDSQSEWDEKLKLLDLLKEIYNTDVEGVDKNSKDILYSQRLKDSLNSGHSDTIVKVINKYRSDLVDLAKPELLNASTLSEAIFSHIMKSYNDIRIEVFTHNLNNNNNDVVLEWIKSNFDLIIDDIVSYQQVILPKAMPGKDPIKIYCEMLASMPVIKGSSAHNERVAQLEVLISHNPGTSDIEILNILNGALMTNIEPNETQLAVIKEKIKTKAGTFADPKEFKTLLRKFYKIKNE